MSDNVIIRTVNQPTMVIVGNQAVSGPAGQDGATGATGATGPAGPNSVTSATSSDGTADLDVATITGGGSGLTGLVSAQITDASTIPVYNETTELYEEVAALYDGEGAINAVNFYSQGAFQSFNGDNYASFIVSDTPISWLLGTKQFSIKEPLGNGGQCTIPDASGTFALTSAANGEPDKLTNGTITGTLTINSTSYTYGTGAAAAMNAATGEIRKYKSTDETRTTASLVVDSALQSTVEANGVYAFEIQMYFKGTGSHTMNFGVIAPSLANTSNGDKFGIVHLRTVGGPQAAWFGIDMIWSAISPPTYSNGASPNVNDWLMQLVGVLQIGSTGGTVGPIWNNAASLGTVTVKAGSYMKLTKLNV